MERRAGRRKPKKKVGLGKRYREKGGWRLDEENYILVPETREKKNRGRQKLRWLDDISALLTHKMNHQKWPGADQNGNG